MLQHAEVLRALLAGLSAFEQTVARSLRRSQLSDNLALARTTEEESRRIAAVIDAPERIHRYPNGR